MVTYGTNYPFPLFALIEESKRRPPKNREGGYHTHLRLRISIVVRKLRVALRPVVVRQLQHWSPRSAHSLVRRGRVSGRQRRNFFGRQGLQEVQAEAFEVELTHLPQEASPREKNVYSFRLHSSTGIYPVRIVTMGGTLARNASASNF